MKITNKQLKQIIEEEVSRLKEVSLTDTGGLTNSLRDVKAEASKGDTIEKQVMVEMRQQAINDFTKIYVSEIDKQVKFVITRNPDIESEEDLSTEFIRSIKEDAAKNAVSNYKKTYTNTVLLADYFTRIERQIGKPVPPTLQQLIIRYAKDFAYQFVFGFIDNFILILAGAAIDDYVKQIFGSQRLQKILAPEDLDFITDGIGNTISDGVGDLGGGSVESGIQGWEWLKEAATDKQVEIAPPTWKIILGTSTFTGVVLGCIVAIPLGILVLKLGKAGGAALAARGQGMRPGMGAKLGIVGAIASLVAIGALSYAAKNHMEAISANSKKALDNTLSRVYSRLQKQRNQQGEEIGLGEYTSDMFVQDLAQDPDNVQLIWSDEMDFAELASHPDLNYNEIWKGVDLMSDDFNLNNPNRSRIDESRWSKLAGIKG